MNKLIAITIALLLLSGCDNKSQKNTNQNWQRVGSAVFEAYNTSQIITFYIDKSTIKKDGNLISFDFASEYEKALSNAMVEVKHTLVNCLTQQYGYTGFAEYEDKIKNGLGKELRKDNYELKYRNIAKDMQFCSGNLSNKEMIFCNYENELIADTLSVCKEN